MAIALDYTSRIDPGALRAAGVTVVCRYLSWLHYWGGLVHTGVNPKVIQGPEYAELRNAGLTVVLNWEYDAKDWLGGAAAGAEHAAEAVQQARALGHPAGAPIIGSADFNMTRAQWDSAGHAYATAFEAGVRSGGFMPGVYGPYDVLTWCRDETGMAVFWQAGMSTSWSNGRNAQLWPGAHLCQRGYKTVGGVSADWNDIIREVVSTMELDYGQQGPPTGTAYATGLNRATQGQAVFLADLAGQEMIGASLYNGSDKSYRTKLLDRVDGSVADLVSAVEGLQQAVALLGSGGVDVDALADKVATKIGEAVAKAFATLPPA